MNGKNRFLGAFFGGGLLSGSVYAHEANPDPGLGLEDAAAEHGARIVWVEDGAPLYQVASTFVRDTEKSAVADGTVHESELIKTLLCDPEWNTYQAKIKEVNNEIADLTAHVADHVGMVELAAAMRLDSVMVRLKEGTTCGSNTEYEVVSQGDSLRGDGLASVQGIWGTVPIAVPERFLPDRFIVTPEIAVDGQELAVEPEVDGFVPPFVVPSFPETSSPSLEGGVESTYKFEKLALGAHYIREGGFAPLTGWGGWLEARLEAPVSDSAVLAFDANHIRATSFTYSENTENIGSVVDLDLTLGTAFPLSKSERGIFRFNVGVNGDAQLTHMTYSDLKASTSLWAVGPEVKLLFDTDVVSSWARASYGKGNFAVRSEASGYVSTKDDLGRAQAEVGFAYALLPSLRLGALGSIENDAYTSTLQDGGLVPSETTKTVLEGRLIGWNLPVIGVRYSFQDTELRNDAPSVGYFGGIEHTF